MRNVNYYKKITLPIDSHELMRHFTRFIRHEFLCIYPILKTMQEVIRRLLKGLLDVEASDLCTLTFESKKDGGNFFFQNQLANQSIYM